MEEYVGLDVSMEETSVCVMDGGGRMVWEGKVATEPGALVRALHVRAPGAVKVGLETGPLSTWLWHALRDAGGVPGRTPCTGSAVDADQQDG